MMNAYILVMMRPGDYNETIKEMRKIENIEKISVVAGEYDIVVRVRIKNLEDLLKITNKIQMIKNVKKTTTQIIEKEITL